MGARLATGVAFALCWLWPFSAGAQTVVTVCGAASGYSFYLNPSDGWQRDGISQGTVTILRNGDDFDLIIKDAWATFSARGDEATVVRIYGDTDREMTLVAIYPLGSTEVYQLTLDANGRGKLIWATTKNGFGPLIKTKGSLF